jgi:hypothetical protein
MARLWPTSRTNRAVPPQPVVSPLRIWAKLKRACGVARRKSQAVTQEFGRKCSQLKFFEAHREIGSQEKHKFENNCVCTLSDEVEIKCTTSDKKKL